MCTFGEEMRSRLQQLHIGVRRVDDSSRQDANREHNGCLHISRYRLRELQENAEDITVAEVAELAKLCHTTFEDLLGRYLSCYPELLSDADYPPSTLLLPEQPCEWLASPAPPRSETGVLPTTPSGLKTGATCPLRPSGSHYMYGRIGLDDRTMWPLLRPGSIVRVDTRQKVIARHGSWRNDYDRPIYFLEIRDGFACGWCDLYDRQLILTPHSLSPASPRYFIIGREVEIRGRVMGYAVDCESASDIRGNSGHVAAARRPGTEHTPLPPACHTKGIRDARKNGAENERPGAGGTSPGVIWLPESA